MLICKPTGPRHASYKMQELAAPGFIPNVMVGSVLLIF